MKNRVSQRSRRWSGLVWGAFALTPVIALAQQVQGNAAAAPAPQAQAPAPVAGQAAGQAARAPAAAAPAAGGISNEKSFPQIASGKWTGPRLPDGQPDVQGFWSNTIANHNNFTDPQGGIPNDPNARNRPMTPREERAPSRVSDPADGQIPFQPWAAAKVKEFQTYFNNPIQPQYIEPLARCAPTGIPKSLYWHGYEIRQYPGYVLFLFDSSYRLIHLDGKPHLPEKVKLWNADSRGRWEGNTLVVDVRNNNGKALFGRSGEFSSENVHVEERYIFSPDNKRYNYVATFTDPTVYTKPWTATIPARRWTEKDQPRSTWHFKGVLANYPAGKTPEKPDLDHFERICVENNVGFGNVAQAAPK